MLARCPSLGFSKPEGRAAISPAGIYLHFLAPRQASWLPWLSDRASGAPERGCCLQDPLPCLLLFLFFPITDTGTGCDQIQTSVKGLTWMLYFCSLVKTEQKEPYIFTTDCPWISNTACVHVLFLSSIILIQKVGDTLTKVPHESINYRMGLGISTF